MGTLEPSLRFERAQRVLGAAGALIAAGWGVHWLVRVQGPFGREGGLQLLFSFTMAVVFGARAAGRNLDRWRWAHTAILAALWVWRCSFKHYPLGVVTFSILAGLALIGVVIASWRLRAAPAGRTSS